jgi:hypothetical protein
MSALFNPPEAPKLPPPPAPPQITDPKMAMRADEERRQRALAGRASQFMTNPQTQNDPGPSRTRTLGTL